MFVGESGSNMKNLAKTHGVTIERVKKCNTKIRVFGNEPSVNSAVSAVNAWVNTWEAKNKGNTMVLGSSEMEFLLADNKFLIKDVEKSNGVKIDIDVAKCTVIIRSKSKSAKESASANICSFIEKFKAELSTQEVVETEVDNVTADSQEESQEVLQKNETKEQLTLNTITDTRENIPTILHEANITKPLVTHYKAASSLFNLLISNDTPTTEELAPSQEQW